MTAMKKAILIFSLFLILFCGWAKETFFPIISWGLNPGFPDYFRDLAGCGINIAGFATPQQLDAVHAAGLKAYVYGWKQCSDMNWSNLETDARARFAPLAAKYNDHPAVIGYFLCDEPPARFFPGIRRMSDIIRELAPGRECYVGMLPNYAQPRQLGTATYEDYTERYIRECRPTVLRFNFYCLYENSAKIRPGYWKNLKAVRAAALKHDLRFHVCVGCTAHFNHPVYTRDKLMFQVFMALAYGAKGIEYFQLYDGQTGNYRMSPIDAFGERTATYTEMRYVNKCLNNLGPILLKLKSMQVYHFPADPDNGADAPGADSLILSAPGGEFVAGDFLDSATGAKYVMIVNRSLSSSRYIGDLVFRKKPAKIRIVSPFHPGALRNFTGEECWLAPGHGKLLKLDE